MPSAGNIIGPGLLLQGEPVKLDQGQECPTGSKRQWLVHTLLTISGSAHAHLIL